MKIQNKQHVDYFVSENLTIFLLLRAADEIDAARRKQKKKMNEKLMNAKQINRSISLHFRFFSFRLFVK